MISPAELLELDRPRVTRMYVPWGQNVSLRKLSALAFVKLQDQFSALDGEDCDRMLQFNAMLLAATVEDPQCSTEEWLQLSLDTMTELAQIAMEVCGLVPDAVKKN